MAPLLGPSPPRDLADVMHAAWIAFATTGDPGWPSYELEHRTTQHFNTVSEWHDDPRAAERKLWDGHR